MRVVVERPPNRDGCVGGVVSASRGMQGKAHPMTGIYGRGLKGKASRLHSLVVRARGACERCGERDYQKLQAAHIVPRRYSVTRCDPEAAWCLCAGCHLRTTEWAEEHMRLVDATVGRDRYEQLRRMA